MILVRRAGHGAVRLHSHLATRDERERGDVPGWVMITLMTAVIVVLIWGIASDELQSLLKSAFAKVNDQSGTGTGG